MRRSWPIEFPSIRSSNNSIYYLYSNSVTLFSNPPYHSSLDPTNKDDAFDLPADLGQPDDVLALMGSLPGESFDGFFASLPEN